MAKKRRKKQDDTHVDETWLIPYADMLTLLLALFIVLFAASTIDEVKYGQISDTFQEIFTGNKDLLDEQQIIEKAPHEKNDARKEPDDSIGDPDAPKKPEESDDDINGNDEIHQEDWKKLNSLKAEIDQYFVNKGLDVKIETTLSKEGLLITFPDSILFASGSAEVTKEARALAKEVSEFLVTDPPREVRISGHTDNNPIHTAQFPSNWELSSARSVNFMMVLLRNRVLEPSRFSATAFGEFRPVASNKTAEGRKKNRRVEILILPYEANE
jgi:chemotaxis protein MotB